jgi:predicted transcriptional regulator with HTH domain
VKNKINIVIDDTNLQAIVDILLQQVQKSSVLLRAPSPPSTVPQPPLSPSSSSSSSSSWSMSSRTSVSIFDMYRHDEKFLKFAEMLEKNDKTYFEECISDCTKYDKPTSQHLRIEMMAVRAREKISSTKKVTFGLHWGQVVPRAHYEKFKHIKYSEFAKTLRVLPVGKDKMILADVNSLGSNVNSASAMYIDTRYKGEKPICKVRLIQAARWPGVYFYETSMGRQIEAGEEVFTLYVDENNQAAAAADDENEATLVSTPHEDDDDEVNDPSVTSQEYKTR